MLQSYKEHKLEVYATKLQRAQTGSLCYKDVHLFMGFTIKHK